MPTTLNAVNTEKVQPGHPWIPGRIYIWMGKPEEGGDGWHMVPPPSDTNRQNAAFYLIATSDLTEGAPEAVFSFAQVRSLLASSIFADLIDSFEFVLSERFNHDGTLRQGSIRSSNYDPSVPQEQRQGFRVKHNGEAEFLNAIVRGHIEADSGTFKGNLEAKSIHITGAVNQGTSYVIRANNSPVSGNNFLIYSDRLKQITTAAYGTVTVRVRLTSISTNTGSVTALVYANNESVGELSIDNTNADYHINISLPNSVSELGANTVEIRFRAGGMNTSSVTISTFEIRCNENPGFLRLLG